MSRCLQGPASVAVSLLLLSGCRALTSPCHAESGAVLDVTTDVQPDAVREFTVVSPKNSNLSIRLTWPDTAATLDVRATITDCGEHAGCQMNTSKPAFGPGGSSPVPQPWPPGLREMLVDGTKGKTYRIEIVGDPARATMFTLNVRYQITCER